MSAQQSSQLLSLSQLDTQTSLSGLPPEGKDQARRFRRSNSGDRSKSKELDSNPRENLSFYVKNVFSQAQSGQERLVEASPEGCLEEKTGEKSTRAEGTPIKGIRRRNNHIKQSREMEHLHSESTQHLHRRCEELNLLLEKSHVHIIELESKVAVLEDLARKGSEGGDCVSKEASGEAARRERGNNLARLRKQIAQTKTVEVVPTEVLSQQIKMLQAENLCLKQEVGALKLKVEQYEQTSTRIRSEKQAELERVIDKQRRSLRESQKREDQLRLQIGMLRLRESKKSDNKQQAQSEELIYLRYRYQKMRKKYQQTRKALEQSQERQQRTNYQLSSVREQGEVTLELTP